MNTTSNPNDNSTRSDIHRLMPELMQLVDEIAGIADSGKLPSGVETGRQTQDWASEWRRKILTPGRNNG